MRSRVLPTAVAISILSLAACDRGAVPAAGDGDTGAAAPATQQTLSPNPAMGDSAPGAIPSAGVAAPAGDTAAARARADSAKRP